MATSMQKEKKAYYRQGVAYLLFACIAFYFSKDHAYLASLDGPAHLYNSILLKEVLSGNTHITEFHEWNSFLTPNLFSNVYLAGLLAIFPLLSAIKIFYVSLLFLLLAGPYLFFRSHQRAWPFFLSLAFTLLFNAFLLNLGFYNFSFSVAFLFLALYALQRYQSTFKLKYLSLLFSTSALMYYANGFTFMVFAAYWFLLVLTELLPLIGKREERGALFRTKALPLLLLLPFVWMFLNFSAKVQLENTWQTSNFTDKWNNLKDFTSFITYIKETEVSTAGFILILMTMAFALCVILRFLVKTKGLVRHDIFLLFALIFAGLYFFVPDGFSVGMMSARLQYFVYVFALIWILLQPFKGLTHLLALVIFYYSVSHFRQFHQEIRFNLNQNAAKVAELSKRIMAGKTIASFNYSENWLEAHYADYLGLHSGAVVLENYEASVGWFPLVWKQAVTNYHIGTESSGLAVSINPNAAQTKAADYVFVYGNLLKFKEDSLVHVTVNKHYFELPVPEHSFFKLYRLRY